MIRILCIASLLLSSVVALAKDKPLTKYNTIVLQQFKADPELVKAGFPSDYESVLEKTLFARLLSERVFESVADSSLDPSAAKAKNAGTLIAGGEVVDYSKGNRAARVIVSYGVGAARLRVVMTLRDAATGNEVLRIEQEGSYAGFGDLTGGSAEKARTESARKVVDGLVKKIRAAR